MDPPDRTPLAEPTPTSSEPVIKASAARHFFNRLLGGLLFVLPVVITLLVVYQIYGLVLRWLIEPVALLIMPAGIENEYWRAVETYVTPPLALIAVVLFLYLAGYIFQTRVNRWVNWCFARVPGVSTLYGAMQDVLAAMRGPQGLTKIDTVVLVPFPHMKSRMVGYLMGERQDVQTGQKLACVYVPIGVFPPSGYTLVLPWDEVTVTDWGPASPWKMLLSGGLTLPAQVPYGKTSGGPAEQ